MAAAKKYSKESIAFVERLLELSASTATRSARPLGKSATGSGGTPCLGKEPNADAVFLARLEQDIPTLYEMLIERDSPVGIVNERDPPMKGEVCKPKDRRRFLVTETPLEPSREDTSLKPWSLPVEISVRPLDWQACIAIQSTESSGGRMPEAESADHAEYIWALERLWRAALDEYKDCPSWQPLLSEARIALDELWRMK